MLTELERVSFCLEGHLVGDAFVKPPYPRPISVEVVQLTQWDAANDRLNYADAVIPADCEDLIPLLSEFVDKTRHTHIGPSPFVGRCYVPNCVMKDNNSESRHMFHKHFPVPLHALRTNGHHR
jgi:hypothetical protein